MADELPKRIGHYVPVSKLGQGGMGVVYCARDDNDPERMVALKVISAAAVGARDDTGKRFQREARILEGLRHQNIVRLYEVGVHGKESYFAMELLSGSTLSPYAGRPWQELLPLFVQICAGMRYLAARRIIHRDLSPDNIFVVSEGGRRVAKILDFGIAKDTAAQETIHDFTRTGLLMGKPMYWSPEQIGNLEEGEKIDWRSDVYALGVIFYRILAARLPFKADTPVGYISLHLSEPPAPLTAPEGAPPLPEALVSVIARMLEKDRKNRPENYKEIVDVFHALMGEELTDVEAWSQELPLPGDGPTFETDQGRTPTPRSGFSLSEAATVVAPTRSRITTATSAPTAMTPQPRTAPMNLPAGGASAGAATTPTAALPGLPEEARPATRRTAAIAAVAALVVAAVAGGLIWRSTSKDDERVLPSSTGMLALSTLPWARVVSIRADGAEKDVALASELTTPALIPLAPARYRVTLASGLGPETTTLDVVVGPGETVERSVTLVTAERAVTLLE